MDEVTFECFQQFQLYDNRLSGFHIIGTVQPADHSSASSSSECYDIRTAGHPHEKGGLWIDVYEDDTMQNRIGWAQFSGSVDACRCENINIEASYRRSGIASALYDLAEVVFGMSAVPTANKSQLAAQFWKTRLM